jgi:hypothetical protein
VLSTSAYFLCDLCVLLFYPFQLQFWLLRKPRWNFVVHFGGRAVILPAAQWRVGGLTR